MSERQSNPYDSIARKWLALVDRRQAALIELLDSGRWKHYFTEAEVHDEMANIAIVRNQWARIAGLLPDEEQAEPESERRSAA
jgi:predicted neuraminidase